MNLSFKIKSLFNFAFNGRSEWSQHQQDLDRIAYAKANPWVLSYDFGHKELMEYEKSFNQVI